MAIFFRERRMDNVSLQKPISNRRLLRNLLIVSIVFSLFITALNLNRNYHYRYQTTTLQQGAQFAHPTPFPSFSLTDQNGRSFTKKNLLGHWSLLFFSSTQDISLAATALTELRDVYTLLENENEKELPLVVLISMNPNQDTRQKLSADLKYFNARFVGATGNKNQLSRLVDLLKIIYSNNSNTSSTHHPKTSDENEQFTILSGLILVVNPTGEWVGVLIPPYDPKIMADDFLKFQRNEG